METARALIARMIDGQLSSEALVKHCIDAIDSSDDKINAWAFVDRENALQQARDRDVRRAQGKSLGLLHGIPVGLKDIVDTRDMPTQRGSVIYADRQPDSNAAIVEKLIEQGAVILGKTVTTELAWMNESHTSIRRELKTMNYRYFKISLICWFQNLVKNLRTAYILYKT